MQRGILCIILRCNFIPLESTLLFVFLFRLCVFVCLRNVRTKFNRHRKHRKPSNSTINCKQIDWLSLCPTLYANIKRCNQTCYKTSVWCDAALRRNAISINSCKYVDLHFTSSSSSSSSSVARSPHSDIVHYVFSHPLLICPFAKDSQNGIPKAANSGSHHAIKPSGKFSTLPPTIPTDIPPRDEWEFQPQSHIHPPSPYPDEMTACSTMMAVAGLRYSSVAKIHRIIIYSPRPSDTARRKSSCASC